MRSFADKPTIVGRRVRLRPVVAGDADAMWASLQDVDNRRLTGTHTRFTRDTIDRWVATRSDQHDRLDLAVTDLETGRWLGELAVTSWDPPNRSCDFRIALDREAQDRGVGSEAIWLIVGYIFEHLPIDRIGLDVYDFNDRAIAVYERVGFVREGRMRAALRWDGQVHDSIVMSILRADWPPRSSGQMAG